MQEFGHRAGWLLAGALAALLPALAMWGFTVDDALIPVRYAQHLVTGAGWRFDAGGPSADGVTPLPWPVLLAPLAHAPALAVLWRARALGLVAWGIAGAALGAAVGRRTVAPAWGRAAALVALSLSVPIAAHAVSGMETALATSLATFAVIFTRRLVVTATLAGLAATLRPELAPWALVLSVGVAIVARRGVRGAVMTSAIALAPFMACALVRVLVWGRPAPLALMAKPGELSQGIAYAGAACVVCVTPLLVLAPFALRRSHVALVIVAAAVAHVTAIAAVGGDWMPFARLMAPVAPSLAWAAVLASEHATRWATASRSAAAIALAAFLLVIGRRPIADARRVVGDRASLVAEARPLLEGATRIAALDVGWVGAATEADVVDLAGLTDPEIAALPGGHTSKRVDAMFLLARDPDALVFYRPPRVVEARLEADDVVARHFETSAWLPLGSGGSGYVVMTRRRRTPPPPQVEPAPVAVPSALESPSLPPKAPIADPSASMPDAPACRTASDCPAGELCCRSTLTPNGQGCMQADTVDGEPCMLQACAVDAGAPCPAGQACRDGFCRPSPRERATCKGARCPEGQPFCQSVGGAWSCSAEPGLACTKPSDCGAGMHCCTSDDPAAGAVTTSECARACAPPVTEDVCERDRDCPPLFVTGADHGLRPRPCSRKPMPGSPPGLRLCGSTIPP